MNRLEERAHRFLSAPGDRTIHPIHFLHIPFFFRIVHFKMVKLSMKRLNFLKLAHVGEHTGWLSDIEKRTTIFMGAGINAFGRILAFWVVGLVEVRAYAEGVFLAL